MTFCTLITSPRRLFNTRPLPFAIRQQTDRQTDKCWVLHNSVGRDSEWVYLWIQSQLCCASVVVATFFVSSL